MVVINDEENSAKERGKISLWTFFLLSSRVIMTQLFITFNVIRSAKKALLLPFMTMITERYHCDYERLTLNAPRTVRNLFVLRDFYFLPAICILRVWWSSEM